MAWPSAKLVSSVILATVRWGKMSGEILSGDLILIQFQPKYLSAIFSHASGSEDIGYEWNRHSAKSHSQLCNDVEQGRGPPVTLVTPRHNQTQPYECFWKRKLQSIMQSPVNWKIVYKIHFYFRACSDANDLRFRCNMVVTSVAVTSKIGNWLKWSLNSFRWRDAWSDTIILKTEPEFEFRAG